LFSNLSLKTSADFQEILALLFFVAIGFVLPLYISGRIILKTKKITSNSQHILGIWGTIWILTLLPVSFITLYINLADTYSINDSILGTVKNLSYADYFVLLYLVINLSRIVFLFIFSAYLKIERFDVTHISINKLVLGLITAHSIFILFKNPVSVGELAIDTLFNLLQSTTIAYISASVLLDAYYFLISTKPSVQLRNKD
jgi:hypothetical protein